MVERKKKRAKSEASHWSKVFLKRFFSKKLSAFKIFSAEQRTSK